MSATVSNEKPPITASPDLTDLLLARGTNPCRPALENRVAFQWEQEGDTLGFRNAAKRNQITLEWLAAAVAGRVDECAVLDVGCAYGNMLLMLNAKLERRINVHLVGIDLHPEGVAYASGFAAVVPGYTNCRFQIADLTSRLPFPAESFDGVNLGDVLEHMEDPRGAVQEIARVLKPAGILLVSTPLRDSLAKRLARAANRLTRGRLYRVYYAGKGADLDSEGQPIMNNPVGNDHVSEMTLPELCNLLKSCGFKIKKRELMPVMSGSKWFDRHPFLLSALLFLEAVQGILRLQSLAHGVILLAQLPDATGSDEG